MSYPANYLYVVSETDMVSAELLSKRLQTDGIVNFWENNSFKKQDALPVSLEVLEETAHKISLEAIGIAVGSSVSMPVRFNFISGSSTSDGATDDPNEPVHIPIGENGIDISPNAARNVALAAGVVLLIPAILAFILVPMVANQKQTLLDEVNAKLQQTDAEIKRLQEEQNKQNDFDVNAEIKKFLLITDQNLWHILLWENLFLKNYG